mgnify:CR=1 FL=1
MNNILLYNNIYNIHTMFHIFNSGNSSQAGNVFNSCLTPPMPSNPPEPSYNCYNEASRVSCNAMSELAKRELNNNNSTFLYNVDYPACNRLTTYRDWRDEFSMLAGPPMAKKRNSCWNWKLDKNYGKTGEWTNVFDQTKILTPDTSYDENTKNRVRL